MSRDTPAQPPLFHERRRLEDLLAQAPAAIALLSGPEHRWTYVNEQYVRVTGRNSAGDFIGKTLLEALPELASQEFARLMDEVYRTGEPYSGRETRAVLNRAASGLPEQVYFDFIYQPVRDAEGNVEGVLVHAVEVTDRVLSRRAGEEAAERLRLAQTAAQIGTWEWDPINNVQILSPDLRRLLGIEESDPDPPATWAPRVDPADWPRVQQNMEEGEQSGSMEFEYRYHHPQFGMRWFYCKGRRRYGETRMLGILQDVTARKKADQASQWLAAIVASSDDAIVSKDLNGIVTSWNAGAERIFGYSAQEMIGRPITTIIPPELQQDEVMILQTIARGERIEHFETVRMNRNGERLDVSLTISPVKDEMGRIVGAAKIARDITQHKKAERALRTTERLASVGRLAATVAHEINNPLEAVTNLVYLAKTSAVKKEVVEYLDAAEEELERVSHMTKQTLGFYRETTGMAQVRLGDLVTSLVSMFSSRARNKGVELLHEMNSDPEIQAVRGEIRQLIANLLSNSIDAVGPGGRVCIRVSAARDWGGDEGEGVLLSVGDNGPGIPRRVRDSIFEPFFTTKKDVGTGLGLWVCKNIVEKHGGSIRFRTATSPHRNGTVFSVFLPLGQPAVETLKQAV